MTLDEMKLYKDAQDRVSKDIQDLQNIDILPSSEQLNSIGDERLKEKLVEKSAPSTGYPELDLLVKGFIPGHLYTLTGETNVGKTSIAANFVVRVASQKKRVLYFALEPGNSVVDYIASVYYQKPFDELTESDYKLPFDTVDVYTKDQVRDIDTLVKIVESSERYDLIIIDHIGYFVSSEKNTIQEQSNVVKKLALLAKSKLTAIMLIAHLRKRSASQRKSSLPSADDISGSAAFKQDSTEVFIVTRMPKTDDKDEVRYAPFGRLTVCKTKSGPNGSMSINFSDRSALIFSDQEGVRGKYGR